MEVLATLKDNPHLVSTTIKESVKDGNLELLKLILNRSNAVYADVVHDLCAKFGYTEMFKYIYEVSKMWFSQHDSMERIARANGNVYVVKFLTGKHEKIPEKPVKGTHKDLCYAAENGSTDLVLRMIQGGVDPSVNDNEAIRLALKNGYKETAGVLLEDKRVGKKIRKLAESKR